MNESIKLGDGYWAFKENALLAYNDENNNFKPIDLNSTRASAATRVNKLGLIESVNNGVPRVDYLNNPKGSLLLEPQSTNLLLRSEEFDNGAWLKQRLNISSNNTTAPNGNLTANKIIATIDNNTHRLIPPIFNTTVGVPITYSFFAKSAEYNEVQVFDGRFTGGLIFTFNLNTGVVTNGPYAPSSLQASAKVVNLVNGWKRISVTVIPPETTTTASLFTVQLSINNVATFAGDNVSGIYFWGAQLEQLPYATSYIPTVASTVTRVAETVSKTGLSSYINGSENTIYLDLDLQTLSSNRHIGISDNTLNNRIQCIINNAKVRCLGIINGVSNFDFNSADVLSLGRNKIALSFKQNSVFLYVNGINVGSDLTTSIFPQNTLNTLKLSDANNTVHFYDKVKDLRIFNQALTDQELQTLTSL